MKLKKVRSTKEIEVNISKYRIKWDARCRSKFQFELKQWFRRYWENHICLEEFRLPGSLLKCDLVNLNKRIMVEINGVQHETYNKHFHRGNRVNFLAQLTRDQIKRDWAEANGFVIVEIEPKDLPLTLEFFREKYGVEIL